MKRLLALLLPWMLSCAPPAQSAPPRAGRLAPEIIQKVVRSRFGQFRACYERGLAADPNLHGRVTVKFVIDTDGAVAMVGDAGSDLPDPKVVSCVTKGFGALRFPPPDGGMVTVVYPIMFNASD
jgi:hypothetical protein